MNVKVIKEKLKAMLPEDRLNHSLNVANCAVKLSEIYNIEKEKAYVSGLVHDCAKYLDRTEVKHYINKYKIHLDELEANNLALSHSIIGAYIVKYEFLIEDEDIISSVRYHTTGKENMSMLEKIIYIADLIEVGRDFPGVDELRTLAYSGNLDEALLTSFNNTIKFVIDNKQLIHPRTVRARNYIMQESRISY